MTLKQKIEHRYTLVMASTVVYHVTLASRLAGIAASGLKPDSKANIGTMAYDAHRKGKLFFTDSSGIGHWKSKAEDFAEDAVEPEDLLSKLAIPVVLRATLDGLEPDELANSDIGQDHAYYTTASIPANLISVFYNGQWLPVSQWKTIDFKDAFDFGDESWDVQFKQNNNDPFFPKSI